MNFDDRMGYFSNQTTAFHPMITNTYYCSPILLYSSAAAKGFRKL